MAVMRFALVLVIPFIAIAFSFHLALVVTVATHLAAVPFSIPVSIAVSVSIPVAVTLVRMVSMWPFRKEARNGYGGGRYRQKQNPDKMP